METRHGVPEPGVRAVWKIEARAFPAFIVVDDTGDDFLARFQAPMPVHDEV